MRRDNFYRRDPGAALAGMAGMSLEERGVYNTIIDLLYLTWRPVEDNRAYIAGHCGCAVQKLNPLINRLISAGKLVRFEEGGQAYISNPKFEAERKDVKGATKTRSGRAVVDEKSPGVGEKSASVEENPHTCQGEGEQKQPVTTLDKSREEKIEGTNVPSDEGEAPVKGRVRKRSPETEIPDGYPDASALAAAQARLREAGVNIAADIQAERFRNHALQNERRCRDWAAAWRNWIIGVIDKAPKSAAVRPSLVATRAPVATFTGPPALRASVVAATDENFAIKFIDPAEWREHDRTLVARNAFAAGQIHRELRGWLTQTGVKLEVYGEAVHRDRAAAADGLS